MAQINEFLVEKPPTSGEVRKQALAALNTGDYLPLTIMGTQEVPKPVPKNIEVRVIEASRLSEGGIRFMGRTADRDIVFLRTGDDETEPATGDIMQ